MAACATRLTSLSPRSKQKLYANKIKPIRKNGHLLLVTLLLANMIVNETLPVIADPILGGGVQSVVVSTVLIVMYVLFSSHSHTQTARHPSLRETRLPDAFSWSDSPHASGTRDARGLPAGLTKRE